MNDMEEMGVPETAMPITPAQLTAALRVMIPAREPALLVGAPGIGKTDIVLQAAEAVGHDILITHPVVEDPTNYKGMPAILEEDDAVVARWLPFGDLNHMIQADKPTVVFLDDLGQAPQAVQAACMQLLLARKIGEHSVSKFVTFLAATNGKQHKAGVTGILEPVKSRFVSIFWLIPTADDWMAWAAGNDMPEELVAYVGYKKDVLTRWRPTPDIINGPSPRTIANLGRLMKLDFPDAVRSTVFAGAVGSPMVAELNGFLNIRKDMPDPDLALKNPKKVKLPDPHDNPGAAYAFLVALAYRGSVDTIDAIVNIVDRWCEEFDADDFGVMLVKMVSNRDPKIIHTKAFRGWMTNNLNVLM